MKRWGLFQFIAVLMASGLVRADDRVDEIAARGTTVDGTLKVSADGKSIFKQGEAIHATVVYDDTNKLFSLEGPGEGGSPVRLYVDAKTMPGEQDLEVIDTNAAAFLAAAVAAAT